MKPIYSHTQSLAPSSNTWLFCSPPIFKVKPQASYGEIRGTNTYGSTFLPQIFLRLAITVKNIPLSSFSAKNVSQLGSSFWLPNTILLVI